jgi:hypothetical protein
MMLNASLKQRFFLYAAPILASSAIAASPARAATLAFSEAEVFLTDFSHRPSLTEASVSENTLAVNSPGGSVSASTEVDAFFANFLNSPPFATNLSSSLVTGQGGGYFGLAQSSARVAGNFFVEAGEEFSFNFAAFLNLATSVDNIQRERATAAGDISWQLFASADPHEENWSLIDFFNLSANLVTPNLASPSLDFAQLELSENVTFDIDDDVTGAFFGAAEPQEFVQVAGFGSYFRSFSNNTHLRLIEVKTNKVTAKTPEPGSILGLFSAAGLIGIGVVRKQKTSKAQ